MSRLNSLLLLLSLIVITLMCLPVWAQETPQNQPIHSREESDGTAIVANRPLVFTNNRMLPPMVYMQDGQRVGIVVDLSEAIKKHMNRPVLLKYIEWSEAKGLYSRARPML